MPAKTRTAPTATAPKSPGTADGKQTTARLVPGDRILVMKSGEKITVAVRKTGSRVATVQAVKPVTIGGPRKSQTRYQIETDLGVALNLAGVQTWWLAPETAAQATADLEAEAAQGKIEGAKTIGDLKAALAEAAEKVAPVVDLAAAAAERREAKKAAIAKKVQAVQAAKGTVKPSRGTWKGHGNPAEAVFFGYGDKPHAEGVQVKISTMAGGTGLQMTDAEGKDVASSGVASKFWLAPLEQPVTEPAKAAAPKAAPKAKATPKAKAERAEVKLPTGYAVKYDNGAYLLAKKGDGAAEDGSAWLVVCSTHGTTTGASKAKEGDEKGRKSDRATWCKGCTA